MATGGRREEMDRKIKTWERDLERLRLALAVAPESVHAAQHPEFVALYRQKEVVKSRWEAIRGVYRPEREAVRRFEEALASMEAAWEAARPMVGALLQPRAA